jgi:dihydrofolate synthase/folylpolyglutamate synthase
VFQHIGKAAYKADLNNTIALCRAFGNPEAGLTCIHVAGTNEGSVSSFLAAIFSEHGYKTGLYTSPHLIDFRERIRINGEMISEKEVMEFTDQAH